MCLCYNLANLTHGEAPMYENKFGDLLKQEQPALVQSLKNGLITLFNSSMVTYAKDRVKNIEARLFSFDECGIHGVMLRKGNRLTVYYETPTEFETFRKGVISKCGLAYTSEKEIIEREKLYSRVFASFFIKPPKKEDYSVGYVFMQRIQKDYNALTEEEKLLPENENLVEIATRYGGSSFNDYDSDDEAMPYCPSTIVRMANALQSKSLIEPLTEEQKQSLKAMSVKALEEELDKVPSLEKRMNVLVNSVKKTEHKAYKSSFDYNDLDNHVWYQYGCLFMSDQNCLFIYEKQDEQNYKVYYLNIEYSDVNKTIAKWKKEVKDAKFNEWDLVLEVKNGEIVYARVIAFQSFELDVRGSYMSLESEDLIINPVDESALITYDYMRKFYAEKYGHSEQEMLFSAFYVLGSGWHYNPESQKLSYYNVYFSPKIAASTLVVEPKSELEGIHSFGQADEHIGKLDKEWNEGLKKIIKLVDKKIALVEASEPKDKERINELKSRQKYLKSIVY